MLRPKLTNIGRDALASGSETKIGRIHLGSGSRSPDGTETELVSEEDDYPISALDKVATGRFHLTSIADNPDKTYPIFEIGYYTVSGLLLAYASTESNEPLAYKLKGQELLLAFDVDIGEIPEDVFSVVGPGERVGLDLAEPMAAMADQVTRLATIQIDMIGRLTGFGGGL